MIKLAQDWAMGLGSGLVKGAIAFLIGICLILTNLDPTLAATLPSVDLDPDLSSPSLSLEVVKGDLDLVQRLELIKTKMQNLRFCFNGSCFYRNISSRITPPANSKGKYTATVSAVIDRPSASPDIADYHFELVDNQWQLRKGEEYTDVADYEFNGDRYEIFSVHNNRNLSGDIGKARIEGNLKSGYISLYFDVLDRGVERVSP